MLRLVDKLLALAERVPIFKLLVPVYVLIIAVFALLIHNGNMQVLNPAGVIAEQQSQIIWGAIVFAIIVGSTLIGSFFFVIFRYKEDKRREYRPDWVAGRMLQLLGWGVPLVAITVISTVLWSTAHALDPYRPISSTRPQITIQVVALRWKWLFLYPNDHLATINELEIPAGTPVALQLTADAPMNSFWIPRLSGQVYAMTGMVTQLHIEADRPGTYAGSPAEMSGDGFAGMVFTVKAVSANEYAAWRVGAAHSAKSLNYTSYTDLARPSSYVAPAEYRLTDANLFQEIVMQFMAPGLDSSRLQVKGTRL